MSNKTRVKKNIIKLFSLLGQHPFLVFLLLFTIAILLATIINYNFQLAYLAVDSSTMPISAKRIIFNPDKAQEYQKIFSILEEREKEYNQNMPTAYPDIFGPVETNTTDSLDLPQLTKPLN